MEGMEKKRILLFTGMSILLLGMMLISMAWGPVQVPVKDMLTVVGKQMGIPGFQNVVLPPEQTAVIWNIRLPRTLVGVLAGAALAVSGAVLQGVFSNSLADPGIIGVSSGASLGAVVAISTGMTACGVFYMPFFALTGALLAVGITVFLAVRDGKIQVMVLLLSGVAISMFMGAMTSGVLTIMNEHQLREFLFWLVGGLDYRRWEHVYLAAGPVVGGITILCILARHINILVLGEQEARALGLPVVAFRLLLLFLAALTTAAAVCVSGTIGFVGLIVPHMMRLLFGPEHRTLLPASALAGGMFLVTCDTLGRMLPSHGEIRVGIMTALVGVPYFLYLLRRAKKGDIS